MNQIHSLEKKRTEAERELHQLRPLTQKLAQLESDVEEVIKKKGQADLSVNRLTLEKRDLENDLVSKET